MNWMLIISQLGAAGFTQQRIATHCDCSQAAISELARGLICEPRHRLGEKLISLHRSQYPQPVVA